LDVSSTSKIVTCGNVALHHRMGDKGVAGLEIATLYKVRIGSIMWVAPRSVHLAEPVLKRV